MSIYDKSSLVLIPSGTKTGKVYSQKPVSGDGDFTFTRSSAATRVNADGFIEKETQNLLNYSNNFGASYWLNNAGSCTRTGGQAGYDGSNDAWLLTQNSAGFSNILSNSTPVSGVYTFSVYAKASSGNTNFTMRAYISTSRSEFNLTTGTIQASSGVIDDNIEDVGGGWYRCSVTFNAINDQFQIYPQWNSSSAESVYIQDAQLEQGLVARDYIETTTTAVEGGITDNVPRLDYTDSSCPALLLEPQRTNPIPQSEYIYAGGSYNFTGSAVLTYNAATSPEGKDNATLFNLPVNNAGFYNFATGSAKSVGDKITMSLFAKLKSGSSTNIIKMGYGGVAVGGDRLSEFNLSTGTIVYSHPSADSVSIEDYGNGWYRLIQTQTCIAAGSAGVVVYGAGNIDVYIWGVQSEDASYATSYIPTYGSSVSRVAEAALKTGVADLINDGDGTLYMEVTPTNFEGDQRFGISDNIGSNRIVLRLYNPSNLQLSCVINSSVEVSIASSGYSAGNTYKIAGAWKNNDAVIYINGVQVATDTNCNITPSNPLTRISFDNGVGTAKWENPVSQTLYFPTRLSNEELAALTTI